LGEDQHGVKKSEWTVLNFSLSQAARKSDEERRQRFFLKSLFSERMSQVASTGHVLPHLALLAIIEPSSPTLHEIPVSSRSPHEWLSSRPLIGPCLPQADAVR
jgi:hypothetical protein